MASYELLIVPSAKREIEAIDPLAERIRIHRKIESLMANPRQHGVEKLAGAEHHYRIRQGDYRIIYRIEDYRLIVVVIRVGHRREVYRKWVK